MRDNWTPIAIAGGFAMIVVSMVIDGSSPAVLFRPAPLILVFGGTLMAGTAGYLKSDMKNLTSLLKVMTKVSVYDSTGQIGMFSALAPIVKKDGIIALDEAKKEFDDEFVELGFSLVSGNKGSEEIREILDSHVEAMQGRHAAGARLFQDMGGYSPTLGIIGTVIGLIHVLGSLTSPASIGPAIASAFTATLWGVCAANIIWFPIAKKLKRATELETSFRNMQIEGILAIQRGDGARDVRERMEAFVPPVQRESGRDRATERAA